MYRQTVFAGYKLGYRDFRVGTNRTNLTGLTTSVIGVDRKWLAEDRNGAMTHLGHARQNKEGPDEP